MKQYLNGKLVDISSEEETKIKEQVKLDKVEKSKRVKEKKKKREKKASAKTKLKDLGLDDDEISALIGE